MLNRVDQLNALLQQAEDRFIINEDAIASRRDSIKNKLEVITRNYQDSVSKELQFLLSEYKGSYKAYNHYLVQQRHLEDVHLEHVQRVENLRQDVVESNLTPEQFQEYYALEKDILEEHLEKVRNSVGTVVKLENVYQRTNEQVTKVYETAQGHAAALEAQGL